MVSALSTSCFAEEKQKQIKHQTEEKSSSGFNVFMIKCDFFPRKVVFIPSAGLFPQCPMLRIKKSLLLPLKRLVLCFIESFYDE